MQVSERLKKEAQTERQKLKEMSFRDKLWYIWEYYKFHILGVLIFLGILWVIGTSIYRSTYESELYCMYINNRSEPVSYTHLDVYKRQHRSGENE